MPIVNLKKTLESMFGKILNLTGTLGLFQSCHFPLWVPREVFWTRRTEEQMRTGYIPLPNIHLLPQRLWYLYPNVFRDKLNRRDISNAKKVFFFLFFFPTF